MPNQDEQKDPFEGAEVIFAYTDAQAVEDGVLVAITQTNRVTRNLFDFLSGHFPDCRPPSCWPVDLMKWFTAKTNDERALAAVRGIIAKYERQARFVYQHKVGGGIFRLWMDLQGNRIAYLWESERTGDGFREVWLMPNEIGGLTFLLPEDY